MGISVSREINNLLENPVLVYGIGRIGKVIVRGLKNLGANVIGIAVTSLADNDNTEFEDVEIREINHWKNYAENAIVIISTGARFFKEIEKNCRTNGFFEIVFAAGELKNRIYRECYTQWANKHDLSLDSDVLQIGEGKYINPFLANALNESNIAVFWDEMGDFIFPAIYNDYSLTVEGPYESGEVMLTGDDVVLDLGANLGLFSVYAASKKCTSYAFEPTPGLHSTILQHSKLNNNRIQLVPYAVSNSCGETVFYLDPINSDVNSLTGSEGKTPLNVQQITVDDFVKQEKLERVDFIKADIEGAERLMLEGAQETLKTFAPRLALCTYHLPDDKEVMTELIMKANPNYKIEYKWKSFMLMFDFVHY